MSFYHLLSLTGSHLNLNSLLEKSHELSIVYPRKDWFIQNFLCCGSHNTACLMLLHCTPAFFIGWPLVTLSPWCNPEGNILLGYCLIASGYCLIASGYCLIASGYCLIASGYCLTASGYCLIASVYCLSGYCLIAYLIQDMLLSNILIFFQGPRVIWDPEFITYMT